MLPSPYPEGRVFIEKTKASHQHGGSGWEFGTCLWSPTRNTKGHRTYDLMLAPQPGDVVIHDYEYAPTGQRVDFYLAGVSRVRASAIVRSDLPEKLGEWAGAKEVYRIELQGFSWFPQPMAVSDFIAKYVEEITEDLLGAYGQKYPFCFSPKESRSIRHVQGGYLTVPSAALYDLFLEEFGSDGAAVIKGSIDPVALEKQGAREGAAIIREVTYFVRNRAMAERIKKQRGYTCEVCGFSPRRDFGENYGQIALDCHHHDPIAVVRKERLTLDSEVSVVCANCHRLLHARRPQPLSVAEAKAIRLQRQQKSTLPLA